MTAALRYSDFGNTVSTRHGLILDVTRRITGNQLSQGLETNQWQLEVRRLFDMSLLRVKMEMLYAVRGTRANERGYGNSTLPSKYRGVCRKLKFLVKDNKNLSFVGILCCIILPILLILKIRKRTLPEWFAVCLRRSQVFRSL